MTLTCLTPPPWVKEFTLTKEGDRDITFKIKIRTQARRNLYIESALWTWYFLSNHTRLVCMLHIDDTISISIFQVSIRQWKYHRRCGNIYVTRLTTPCLCQHITYLLVWIGNFIPNKTGWKARCEHIFSFLWWIMELNWTFFCPIVRICIVGPLSIYGYTSYQPIWNGFTYAKSFLLAKTLLCHRVTADQLIAVWRSITAAITYHNDAMSRSNDSTAFEYDIA